MSELMLTEDVDSERQEPDQISPSALAILNQSEHAAMVQTANYGQNRRRIGDFDQKLKAYANHSQPIALSMFYSLPRGGKQIIGPSVRFAEVVAPCWKNCAVGARGISDSATTVTAQGIFIDYEANLRNSVEVPRRITDKNGVRYGDDMIVVTLNAAMSVARRNAVLKGGVPQALWTPAYEDAQLTAVGKAASHAQRVADAMEYLHKLGITEWQILNSVGVASIKDLETEHLLTLRVLCGEVKRGDKTIEQVFGSPYDKEIDALFTQLKTNDAQQRMLRQSYMGRAQELVEYLNARLGPVESKPASSIPQRPPAQTLATPPPSGVRVPATGEGAAEAIKTALKEQGRYSDPEPAQAISPVTSAAPAQAPPPTPIPEWPPLEPAAPTGVMGDIERIVNEVMPPELNDAQRAALSTPLPPNPLAGYDFGTGAQEPAQQGRRRGRPSKQDMMQRAVQAEPEPDTRTADEALRQVEAVIEQNADAFSF
jgi:hypothetical protein